MTQIRLMVKYFFFCSKYNCVNLLFFELSDGTCQGVCVADRIAEYCEAYLITSGLCRTGSKCCVSRDIYPDKVPDDLRIPNIQMNNNRTSTSKPMKPMMSTVSNSRPKPTKSVSNRPQEPSRESVDNGNHMSQKPCTGECVSGLFALFCDDLDSEAYCSNEGSCCITAEVNDNSAPGKGTTQRPHITVSNI